MAAKRSCYCGEVTNTRIGQEVVLKGWVFRRRDLGGLIFLELRDRAGICQVVLDPGTMDKEHYATAHSIRYEFVLAVRGKVSKRPPGTENMSFPNGDVEMRADVFEVLNTSAPLPFKLDEFSNVNEEQRLRYRYLDLRRPEMQKIFITRSQVFQIVRKYMCEQGFIEFETPILTKSTPEGARDFLVPSRLIPGTFYALPQSPQLFKQLLMVSGYDKYFQIVKCFRDEDLRANRQPEFTQIDIEMSFITPDDLFPVIEGMMRAIFKEVQGRDVPIPFPRLTYAEAMLSYGSDKPELRFGMKIQDVTDIVRSGCDFKVFNSVIEKGGMIRGLKVEKAPAWSRKDIDDLTAFVGTYGAKGLAWFKTEAAGLTSQIAKFFKPETLKSLAQKFEAREGDVIFLVADKEKVVCDALGNLRLKFGRELGLIDDKALAFSWITDFPLLEWHEEDKRFYAAHHPFTSPRLDEVDMLETAPDKVKALAYDLSLNGEEVGGGSIRIHNRDVQEKVFKVLGIGPEEAKLKFGFLLEALTFGAPPHGGIAFGMDRLIMILLGLSSIREVIAFPKTQSGTCMMTDAPSPVDDDQMKTLFLKSTWEPE
ncbi:MAG: aspartate--tRNA ligase [bacterium]